MCAFYISNQSTCTKRIPVLPVTSNTTLSIIYPSLLVILKFHPFSFVLALLQDLDDEACSDNCKMSLTSSLSERAIFCCATTVWGTTLRGEPTDVGSGPKIAGITGPGVKYGLKVLPTWGIAVRYGFVACRVHRGRGEGQKQRN